MAEETRSGAPLGPIPLERDETHDEGLAQAAKQQAEAVWNETRDTVRAAMQEQQHASAADAADFAGVLRTAARQFDDQHKTSAARLAQSAADGLERLSGTLRSKNLDTIVGDVERFARREPALFLGAAVAVGFLAMRFLKSSSVPAHAMRETEREPFEASRREGDHLH